jgi:hypothetical protein
MGTSGQELLVETLGQMLGAITLVCGAFCAIPPTSIVGVMLWTGYFGEAALSHLHTAYPPIAVISLGWGLAVMACVALGFGALHVPRDASGREHGQDRRQGFCRRTGQSAKGRRAISMTSLRPVRR